MILFAHAALKAPLFHGRTRVHGSLRKLRKLLDCHFSREFL
jgi:hypothetical protein